MKKLVSVLLMLSAIGGAYADMGYSTLTYVGDSTLESLGDDIVGNSIDTADSGSAPKDSPRNYGSSDNLDVAESTLVSFLANDLLNRSHDLIINEATNLTEGAFFVGHTSEDRPVFKNSDLTDAFDHIKVMHHAIMTGIGHNFDTKTYLNIAAIAGEQIINENCDNEISMYHAGLSISAGQELAEGLNIVAGINGGKLKFNEDFIKESKFYYGVFLKANQEFKFDITNIDLYVTYSYNHIPGINILGEAAAADLKPFNSHRARIGGKISFLNESVVSPYLGAYVEHEFSGKASVTITINDKNLEHTERLKANLIAAEAGAKFNFTKNFTGRLGVEQCFGANKSTGCNFALNFKW